MADYLDELQRYAKCRAYKDKENPDGRVSLYGEKYQRDENGREFAEIPAHKREEAMKAFPSYEFSQVYQKMKKADPAPDKIILEKPPKPQRGRPQPSEDLDPI
jgi:hypothetical protein